MDDGGLIFGAVTLSRPDCECNASEVRLERTPRSTAERASLRFLSTELFFLLFFNYGCVSTQL